MAYTWERFVAEGVQLASPGCLPGKEGLYEEAWQWHAHRELGSKPGWRFLARKEKVVRIVQSMERADCLDTEDQAEVPPPRPGSFFVYEYHIVYNNAFQVPVLYFSVYAQDGSPASLEEVTSSLMLPFVREGQEKTAPIWNLLSQNDHPVLGRPFFYLHPCNTSVMMETALQHVETARAQVPYLLTWLSIFGPIAGLPPSNMPGMCPARERRPWTEHEL